MRHRHNSGSGSGSGSRSGVVVLSLLMYYLIYKFTQASTYRTVQYIAQCTPTQLHLLSTSPSIYLQQWNRSKGFDVDFGIAVSNIEDIM